MEKCVHFNSIEEFYKNTRKNRIDDLIKKIKKTLPSGGGKSEVSSWENSLPDIALLLYDPKKYYDNTLKMCNDLLTKIDTLIDNFDNYNGVEEELNSFENCTKLMDYEEYKDFKKSLDEIAKMHDKTNTALLNMQNQANEAIKALVDQKKWLKTKIPNDVEVFIEKKVSEKNRIDVLLKYDNRFVIIELKQFTEEYSGEAYQAYDKIKKSVDLYMEEMLKNNPNDMVFSFIYLHNQIYSGGKIYEDHKEDTGFKKFPYLYTKQNCSRFIRAVNDCLIGNKDDEFIKQYKPKREKATTK